MQLLRRLRFIMLLMSMMTLVACGDGDGDLTGDTDTDDTSDVITISLTKSDGELSEDNIITLTANVLSDEVAVVDQTVTFTLTTDDSAIFDPASGTATTDSSGNATIDVKVSDYEGSVGVTATYDTESETISFESAGDGATVVVSETEAASIRLFASTQQLASSGADTIELSAIAKDEDNNLLEGVTISFSADSGALAPGDEETLNVTGSDGKVTMILSTEDEPTNRTITVTATNGDISDFIEVDVVGTSLTLTGSSSLALNAETVYVINVLDSDGDGVAKTPVTISLSDTADTAASITFDETTVTTDTDGQAQITATGITGGANSIIISALGASAEQEVTVQADSFIFTNFTNGVDTIDPSVDPTTPDVALTQTAMATLTWQREGEFVADGTAVTFTTTRGVLSADSATTVDGKVDVSITATDAGEAILTVVGTYSDGDEDFTLSNELEFEFYADTAATILGQASPSSIGPNEQTSTISVVVRDANGNLVKNKKILFSLSDISGGSIFPATAVTDSSGSASTIYTSNTTSASDNVVITAKVEDADIETDVTLTVADRELFISLGTGNELEELDTTDYVKEYSIFVTDADSNAVEGVDLSVTAVPSSYYKGYWVRTYDGDDFIRWVAAGAETTEDVITSPTKCSNEDVNFNGILDDGEDFNSDGELTPGNIVSISDTYVTDSDGRSVIRVIYPQSYAHFLDVQLVVSGKVTGSESSTQAIFTLPVLGDDVGDEDITPPTQGIGTRGPFGYLNDCSLNISDEG